MQVSRSKCLLNPTALKWLCTVESLDVFMRKCPDTTLHCWSPALVPRYR